MATKKESKPEVVEVPEVTFEEFHKIKMSPDIDTNEEKKAVVEKWLEQNGYEQ